MGQRAETLAKQFEEANDEFTRAIERTSDADWRTLCQGEGWSIGVTAHHVAEGTAGISGLAQMAGDGQPLPALTPELLDQGNAAHAEKNVACTKEECIELSRRNGTTAASMVRGLSDEQLDRSATLFGQPMTAQQIIEGVLIGHVRGHLKSMRTAVPA